MQNDLPGKEIRKTFAIKTFIFLKIILLFDGKTLSEKNEKMANEAVIIELLGNGGDPIRYTCANAGAIAKGTLMELTDPRTVQVNQTDNAPVVGIAAHEKVANDGSTTIAVYTNGIFDMLTDAGTDNAGALMANSATANTLQTADAADLLQGSWIGYLLETAGNAEVAAVRILK